jgi:hypothetical protein
MDMYCLSIHEYWSITLSSQVEFEFQFQNWIEALKKITWNRKKQQIYVLIYAKIHTLMKKIEYLTDAKIDANLER